MPIPPAAVLVAIRTPPSAVTAGCSMLKPGHECFQSTVPSAGITLVAPALLNSKTCATPPMVNKCGEL